MISRIMLSMKKAAYSPQKDWPVVEQPASGTNFHSINFFRPQRVSNERGDNIPLDTYRESSTVARQT